MKADGFEIFSETFFRFEGEESLGPLRCMREFGERARARKREGVYLCACGMDECVMSPEYISSGLFCW